ncbi:hypothetical protein DL89DRAFT_160133 [Linderina pennispora]|uniref:Uncharacterized protein n=1 Tax=Linderina pennispora TaxID=61395 RepID=A0A1Y1W753_9FUNG|nr:uncharacterized protein DL89DRAFT_160133 [Linderina pennispora]ORX69369.1 hypothetical protein DL89DRAFT_160133 [Linderina pennispora]
MCKMICGQRNCTHQHMALSGSKSVVWDRGIKQSHKFWLARKKLLLLLLGLCRKVAFFTVPITSTFAHLPSHQQCQQFSGHSLSRRRGARRSALQTLKRSWASS